MLLKMLSTQLTGLFMKVKEREEMQLEDGARLLAQASAGEGKIYLRGFEEMEGVVCEALEGAEPLSHVERLKQTKDLSHTDRVIIFSRFSDNPEAVLLGRELVEIGVPFVSVAAVKDSSEEDLASLADVHINTHVTRLILPSEAGNRTIFPSLITALYIYHALHYTINEILFENN